MATLNTLRTRGGIIVSVVIGIALLAFLLGDLAPAGNSMNSKKTRVGEIDGTKVGYIEYFDKVEYITEIQKYMSGNDAVSTEQQERISDEAWDALISQYAIMPGMEKLGIGTSETEQIDMIDGAYISPVISGIFSDPQGGGYNPAFVRNFINNMQYDQSGTTSTVWKYLKDQMNRQRIMSKYMTLIAQGMFVTDIEVENGVALSAALSDIEYVVEDYSKIADSTIKVSEAEIRKYYDEHKRIFRQVASRDLEYVVFDVMPSDEDYAEAKKYVDEVAAEFAASEAPIQYAVVNSQSQVNKLFFSQEQLPADIAAFAFGPESDKMYGPVLTADIYTIARVSAKQMRPDSLGARHILLPAGSTQAADSIVTAIKGGADFAQLSAVYSVDQAANANGGDLGIFPTESMIPEFTEALIKAKKGEILTVTTPAGLHVVELTYTGKPVEKVQVAVITHEVEPSKFTQDEAYTKASNFVSQASANYDAFKNAVVENALIKRVATIRNTDRQIGSMNNSGEINRWAFNAKAGDVSSIIDVSGNYVVAAVAGAAEDGYATLQKASEGITAILRTEKKGDMLAEKMKGGSLQEIATSLGANIAEAEDVDFDKFYIEGAGAELQLIGAVSAAQPQTLSKPVKGAAGVYVFTVTNREDNPDATTSERERVRLDAVAKGYIVERINQALLEESNIKDLRVKF